MSSEISGSRVDEQFVPKLIAESYEKLSSQKTANDATKRNILKELHKNIRIGDSNAFLDNNLSELLKNVVKTLIVTLTDGSEKCREISIMILKDMVQKSLVSENDFPFVVNALMKRLGKTDEREQSEEIRLLEMDLLCEIIEKTESDLLPCLNDISNILTICIVDNNPDVKRRSCECLSTLASKSSSFHLVASTFFKPLVCTMTHQHLKTRVLCVKALGTIVDYLNCAEFEEAMTHLAQRLFDHSPLVRMTVTEIIGDMLVNLKDRYSRFHHLIPLMLSSLHDEVPEIRSKALNLWKNAGNQYLKENDKDYKDLMDFPRPDPVDYPIKDGRPTLGCRTLVQRNIFSILPALVNDIADWSPETRSKSSKVLYSVLLHSEDKITIQLPKVLEGIMSSARADEKETVEQAINCAELLGYFVDPSHLFDSILSLIHKDPTAVHLSILAAALRGQQKELPEECLIAVCKFLCHPTVSRIRKGNEQANLLLCVEALLSSGNKIDAALCYDLFVIISSVSGLATSETIFLKAAELLQQLSELQSCSKMMLFQQNAIPFLKMLSDNNEFWTSLSPEMPILQFVVESGCLEEETMELIIPVLINNLHHSKDAKLRCSIFSFLTIMFKEMSSDLYKQLSEKILNLIRLGIFPNLTWSAGRTASSLRTIAAASLYEILNKSPIKKEILTSVGDELIPLIATLFDDELASTRLMTCKILEIILPELTVAIDKLKVHTICYEILRCLDDELDDIRLMTIRVLRAYIKSFPSDYDWSLYQSFLKQMFENVLIHMDDKNEKLKQNIFDLLKEVSFVAPDVLLQEIESKRYMMSSSDLCDSLTEHIKNFKI
ncbi:dynein assembly factor 5, axonemal [Trichonephila inaurata madagascariensis]|uniref:Dynein assembly factor 5, axonemal n=1 Tax=Trichonephila inaurata madagascariensis TaxID=2747483 RepID=A0A8X6X014_9ARAC|nr:dynein assembly factor 5, axonemal [Trichonephila inaurata madagascariensis]